MDARLVAWARAVKARRRLATPVLWLFTDAARLADPLPAIARLPPGLCGVVFRHDGVAGRAAMARRVAALCRARRVALTVAGDPRLAASVAAGQHLRSGWSGWVRPRPGRLTTASAHSVRELRAGLAAGALVFLSPAFPTASHPGACGLGPVRWAGMVRGRRGSVLALGGVGGGNVGRLPRAVLAGVGGVEALLF